TPPTTASHQLSFPFLFFYFHGAHRHLHSFPTRRSSDLGTGTVPRCTGPACSPSARCRPRTRAPKTAPGPPPSPHRPAPPPARERSEEHTSELQSRGHLVCRLLLEKKN